MASAPRLLDRVAIAAATVLVVVGLPSASARAEGPGLAVDQAIVDGNVTDVAVIDGGVLVSHTSRGVRKLAVIDASGTVVAGPPVPDAAVAAGACGRAIYLIDSRGLVDDRDRVVIARPPLLAIPDSESLPLVPICPSPQERTLLVREGLVVSRVDDAGAVVDEVLLPFAHRARAYVGGGVRSLKGERPYAGALSLYAPWMFSLDADRDGDLDLVLVHEERALIFRRTTAGLLRGPAVERHLGDLIKAPAGSDLRAHVGGGGLVLTASAGALPEQTVVAVVTGVRDRPLSMVARRDVVDGLAIYLGPPSSSSSPKPRRGGCDAALDFDCSEPAAPPPPGPLIARVDTSLVSLSGVVLTGKVPLEVRRGEQSLLSLPTVADVRAGRVEGAMPVVDVDLDGDGRTDIVDLGEPGRAVLWRGDGAGYSSSSSPALTVPRIDRALGAPALRRVVLIGRAGKKGTPVALVRAAGPAGAGGVRR